MLELADIFSLHGPAYREKFKDRILPSHLRAMRDIEACRTETMGGHVYYCDQCRIAHYTYHSCKNRHCPKCLNDAASVWLQKQRESLLPIPYFFVTFTLPEEMKKIARSNQKTVYSLLFKTSAQALQKLALDKRFVGGRIGMTGVLHTWTRDLGYHLHVHYIVPGGGISGDNTAWLPSSEEFLVRVEPLSIIFRAKFRDELKKAQLFEQVPSQAWKKEWVVHSKPVGKGARASEYLSKYVYRVAISNSRLVKLEGDQVTFRYQDSETKQWKTSTLGAMEFIRRFLQHVLPKGFQKVRRYGFLTPGNKNILAVIQYLLQTDPQKKDTQHTSDPQTPMCLKCGNPLRLIDKISRHGRAPP